MTFCEPCQEKRGIDVPGQDYGDGWTLCDNCRDEASERAWENFCSDYYGGEGPP